MPTYATVADLETNIEGWVTDDPDAAARLLERAERDVDHALGPGFTRDDTTGLKLDPADLDPYEATALARATCAQAYYRFTRGERFMYDAQHDQSKVADVELRGRLPRISPAAIAELADAGLLVRTGRISGPGRGGDPFLSL